MQEFEPSSTTTEIQRSSTHERLPQGNYGTIEEIN